MNVEIFSLCDAATDQQGKLNLLGAFDTVFAKDIPVVHAQCAVALRIRFQRIEQGEHKITVHLIDMDGNLVIPSLDTNINLNELPQNQDSVAINMVLNLQRLQFEKYGEYAINLAVDGRQEASLPLYVRQRS